MPLVSNNINPAPRKKHGKEKLDMLLSVLVKYQIYMNEKQIKISIINK